MFEFCKGRLEGVGKLIFCNHSRLLLIIVLLKLFSQFGYLILAQFVFFFGIWNVKFFMDQTVYELWHSSLGDVLLIPWFIKLEENSVGRLLKEIESGWIKGLELIFNHEFYLSATEHADSWFVKLFPVWITFFCNLCKALIHVRFLSLDKFSIALRCSPIIKVGFVNHVTRICGIL